MAMRIEETSNQTSRSEIANLDFFGKGPVKITSLMSWLGLNSGNTILESNWEDKELMHLNGVELDSNESSDAEQNTNSESKTAIVKRTSDDIERFRRCHSADSFTNLVNNEKFISLCISGGKLYIDSKFDALSKQVKKNSEQDWIQESREKNKMEDLEKRVARLEADQSRYKYLLSYRK